MVSTAIYQVLTPVEKLPPRQIRVINITTDPTSINFIENFKEIVFDLETNNTSGLTATITVNDEPSYTLTAGNAKKHEAVSISNITVTGITTGYLIAHVLPISLLERLNALEVR